MVLAYRRNPEPPGTSVTSNTIADTILTIREAQRATAISLRTWLCWPSSLSKQRLAAAMDTEKDLFDLVFNPDADEVQQEKQRARRASPEYREKENARRSARYASDPEYRKMIKARSIRPSAKSQS